MLIFFCSTKHSLSVKLIYKISSMLPNPNNFYSQQFSEINRNPVYFPRKNQLTPRSAKSAVGLSMLFEYTKLHSKFL